MVEYNLNKSIDTIEDSTALEAEEKIDLIKTFCEYLHRDGFSPEVQKRMLQVVPEEEAFVFKNYESTISLYNTLSKEEKALAKRWTTEMADGMCSFLTRSINTLKDLNDYCYYVAGTAGIYLTNLLRLKGSNITERVFNKLEDNTVSFGLFIQKLNIIRDFVEDNTNKKRAFWPQSYFEHEKDHVKILNKMCYETLKNDVPCAIDYFAHIPPGNDSYDYFIRFILSSGKGKIT
jgi:farnesyl-diphosphate farnesyltransferase